MATRPVLDSRLLSASSPYTRLNPKRADVTLADIWEKLKRGLFGGDQGISNTMVRIEKLCQYCRKDPLKAQDLFEKLKNTFSSELQKHRLVSVYGTVSAEDFIRLQEIRNQYAQRDLCSIWGKLENPLNAVGAFDNSSLPKTFLEIKYWLAISTNSLFINQVTELDLRGLELHTLPREFFKFQALKILQLANNLFTTFPYDLGDFPALEKYSLYEDVLQDFYTNGRLQNRVSLNTKTFPKFFAVVICNLAEGQVLGVRVSVPWDTPCSWKRIYELQWKETYWVGKIPVEAEFNFVRIDEFEKSISDEKEESARIVRINSGVVRKIFPQGDVHF